MSLQCYLNKALTPLEEPHSPNSGLYWICLKLRRVYSNCYYFMRITQLWKSPNYANKFQNYSFVGDSWIPVCSDRPNFNGPDGDTSATTRPPLEFFFQEQSNSSLHSGWSLAWDHVRGDIDDPCGAIANFCGVIADPCGVVVISEVIGDSVVADRCSTR